MLNKIVLKSLRKVKFLLLAVFILFTTASMLLSLSILTFKNLEVSYQEATETQNYENFKLFGLDPKIEDYNSKFEQQFETDFNVNIEKRLYTVEKYDNIDYSINKYQEFEINKINLSQGEFPTKENQILITSNMANVKNLEVGDSYTLDKEYTISGIGYVPQYTLNMELSNAIGSPGSTIFFPIFMNTTDYNKLEKKSEFIYYSGVFNELPSDKNEVYEQMTKKYYTSIPTFDEYGNIILDETFKPVLQEIDLVSFVMDEELNFPLTGLEQEIQGQKTMFRIMSTVVTTIAVMLTIVLFNNIFKSQKREIGILKAEGISNSQLAIKYTLALTFILSLSTTTGITMAYFLRNGLTEIILTLYNFPISQLTNDVLTTTIFINLVVMIIVLLLVLIFAIMKNLKTPVLNLVKNIDNEKPPKLKLNFITKKMRFINRYRINILLRNLSITVVLSFGILVSSFLLLMAVTMYSSISQMASQTYGTIFTYQYELNYSTPAKFSQSDNSILKATADVTNLEEEGTLQDNSVINIFAFDSVNNEFINLQNSKSKPIDQKDFKEGIVLSKIASIYLSAQIGDTITINNPYDSTKELDLKVTNISNDGNSINAYIDLDILQEKLDIKDTYVTGEVSNQKPEEQIDIDPDAKLTDTKSSVEDLEVIIQASTAVIAIIAIFSCLIAFIALVTISTIVINHNRKTISVMKVLGYTNKEITKMTTSIYKWIVIIIYFSAIPIFQIMIQAVVDNAMKDMDFAITIDIDYIASIGAFIVIYTAYYLSITLAKRNINKIKLSESLKLDQ